MATAHRKTRNPNVVWEVLDRDALIVEPGTHRAWLLNPTAAYVWQHCQSANLKAIARGLKQTSGRALNAIEADVAAFCDHLRAAGLLSRSPQIVAVGNVLPVTMRLGRFGGTYTLPTLTPRSLGHGPRSRPGPRGNSSPG